MTADIKKYDNAISFRQALEDRIKNVARQRAIPLIRLRRQITFDRFLARLFDVKKKNQQWLLKGGYALEFRFHNLARTYLDLPESIQYVWP